MVRIHLRLSCLRFKILDECTGKFDHKEKAWLVLWEAKLIIEIPPGALILYPSSLFLHFNVDISGVFWLMRPKVMLLMLER